MGLNFHIRCKRHKVVGMIARGHETEVMHSFYKEHAECRKADPNAVEVQGDEESEQDWMHCPLPPGYTGLDILSSSKPTLVQVERSLERIFEEASAALACDAGELLNVIQEIRGSKETPLAHVAGEGGSAKVCTCLTGKNHP